MKKIISLFIVLVTLFGVVISTSSCYANAEVKIKDKTIRLYSNSTIWWDEKGCDSDDDYYIKTSNKKYIKTYFSPYSFNEDTATMELEISGKKLTSKVKPVVTVYRKDKKGKIFILKKFRFTVKKTKKLKEKNIKVNKGVFKRTSIPVELKNHPVDFYTKSVVFNYSKKGIAKVRLTSKPSAGLYSLSRDKITGYYVKGLKYGKTKVTAKLKGTKIKNAEFYVTVKKIKTTVKKKYKTVTLYYNPKDEVYKQECLLDAVLSNMHSGSKYNVKIKNKKIAYSTDHYSWSQCTNGELGTYIRANKLGKTTVTIYEKNGLSKIKVGSFKLKVKKAKMAEICKHYIMVVDDYGPENAELQYGISYDLGSKVKEDFLYKFKKNEYSISYKVESKKYLSVSNTGMIECVTKKSVDTYAIFTIKFKDGSKFSRYVYFELNDND